jgi:hypothetical protein
MERGQESARLVQDDSIRTRNGGSRRAEISSKLS